MRKLQVLSVVVLALVSGFAMPADAARHKATIKVINESDWTIEHMYLSSTSDKNWGPDQLGDDTIETGQSFTLRNIDCDHYDVRLVDEDGDECVVQDVELCGDHTTWRITNKILLACENDTDQ